MVGKYSDYVPILKVLADETRLQIIDILSHEQSCACNILEHLNITQPTLSYHMKLLTQSGLVVGKKEGIWMHYRLDEQKATDYKQFIEALLGPTKSSMFIGEEGDCCTKEDS